MSTSLPVSTRQVMLYTTDYQDLSEVTNTKLNLCSDSYSVQSHGN